MSEIDFSDLGREIGEKVGKFINSKEVKELQENIRVTVENTMQEVSRSVKEATDNANKNMEKHRTQSYRESQPKERYQGSYYSAKPMQQTGKHENKRQLPVIKNPQGSVSGVLLTVFGIIGATISWTYALAVYFLSFLAVNLFGIGAVSVELPVAIGCVCMVAMTVGRFLRRRVNRFKKYVKAMGEKDFYSIENLAKIVQKKEKYVVKDLKRMIRRRWFREGHLDEQETCFMLTEESYKLYQEAQKELIRRREEEERLAKEQELLEQDPVRKQLKITVEEGKEYIRRIKAANDSMPEEDISNKLYRLERICSRIFEHVEEKPEKLPDIRRFMNYYMPTTLKLVEAYEEFATQPVQGENITTAKKEIEGMLDDINSAFEKMFDKLFEDDVMDISTDISVLSTMLAQEGLLKDEFGKNNVGE
ncbi:MAG: 5-bromo-4-chloroindolyl phosphate hydrolysis protein [Clostridiales bacterium]|nr:5-bromo-4-chloroindolyl phosphate hydrolysis protein [Clostridiales bacterium]